MRDNSRQIVRFRLTRRDAWFHAAAMVLSFTSVVVGQDVAGEKKKTASDKPANSAAGSSKSKLLDLYLQEAHGYEIELDTDQREKLALREEPIYVWTNPLVANGQYGAVYVWTWQGRPEAVGTIFVYNFYGPGQLGLMHEFHSLSPQRLITARRSGGENRWQPKAGIELKLVDDAAAPAEKAAARLSQMRAMAREFSIHTVNLQGERWELRLLPQPLFRYELNGAAVLDGALFALVTSSGTDPEVMLMIEARQTDAGPRWHFAPLRFTLFDLSVKRQGKEIWKSLYADLKGTGHNPEQTYHVYRDRMISPLKEDDAGADR